MKHALQYVGKSIKTKATSIQKLPALVFSFLLLLGIIVCMICDLAVYGSFTWSLIAVSSIVFVWLAFFPAVRFGKKGTVGTLAAVSVFIIPFLFILDPLIVSGGLLLPVGIRMACIGVAFVWCVYALFKLLKTRKLTAAAISLLLVIPAGILVNRSLSRILSEPMLDLWDILSFSIIAIGAGVLFVIDFSLHKK